MGSLRDGCEKVWSWQMVNGNFWKAATLIAMVGTIILTFMAQSDFGRLEERIIGMQTTIDANHLRSERTITELKDQHAAAITLLVEKQDQLRADYSRLNAEVQGYRSLPSQIVTSNKAIEQVRAQMNMILYQVLGMEKGQGAQRVCIDGEC